MGARRAFRMVEGGSVSDQSRMAYAFKAKGAWQREGGPHM